MRERDRERERERERESDRERWFGVLCGSMPTEVRHTEVYCRCHGVVMYCEQQQNAGHV